MKYLRVSINDNDFTSMFATVGGAIWETFFWCCDYPTEKGLENIKADIANLWCSIYMLTRKIDYGDTEPIDVPDYYQFFNDRIKLDIIDSTDLPDWDNAEAIYVPLDIDNNVCLCI